MTSLPKYGVLLTPKYGQKCKFQRVTQNLRVFAYIARRYNSAAESTSLLSSVASLAVTLLCYCQLSILKPLYCQNNYMLISPAEVDKKRHFRNCWTVQTLSDTPKARKRRPVTSDYHGSKISGSQQSFLTETVIFIVERWQKSMGYRFCS